MLVKYILHIAFYIDVFNKILNHKITFVYFYTFLYIFLYFIVSIEFRNIFTTPKHTVSTRE